jgi:hypothetical protein
VGPRIALVATYTQHTALAYFVGVVSAPGSEGRTYHPASTAIGSTKCPFDPSKTFDDRRRWMPERQMQVYLAHVVPKGLVAAVPGG